MPLLSNLEFTANFEEFKKPKTIDNIATWMDDSINAIELLVADFCQFATDGASNAIGSIAEYKSQTREERSNDISVSRCCVSHNNKLSLGYASGLLDYANPVNVELGDILKKAPCITGPS
jgi:hypothetical protein